MTNTTPRQGACAYCKSSDTIWKGYRSRVHDRVRLKYCKRCKRKYTTSAVARRRRRSSSRR